MEQLSKGGEGFPRGSESSRANIPLVASRSCWGLANAGTLTGEDSWRKLHVPSCNLHRAKIAHREYGWKGGAVANSADEKIVCPHEKAKEPT